MGTLSVRLDNETEELLKQLLSSRKMKASDLVREMIEKEAAGGLLEAVNSVQLAVDVMQDRLAELETELATAAKERRLIFTQAARSAHLFWEMQRLKKTPEEIAVLEASEEQYMLALLEKLQENG